MKYESATYLIAFFGLATAAPMPVPEPKNVWSFSIPKAMLRGREVPQEHSHDRFLDGVRVNLALNNPNNIQDPVFGLLGNAAAAAGAGSITNLDCLHQATADQAFTNAKAAGNVTGQADALMYAALERNTGSVGLASVICNETAVNPEIQAVQQHQDPASTGAAASNKAVVLALAQQLASIGADPQEALLSGTFAPGNVDDDTGKGNTCDTLNDPDGGCIFSQNLLVDDATADEITAAVADIASGSSASGSTSTSSAASSVASDATVASSSDAACSAAFVTETASATASAAVEVAATSSSIATVATSSAASTSTGSLDFGSCSNPAILFENGLDGRTQPAFIAANQADFNHGSALNIAVIAGFICQRLGSPCDASADAQTACIAAEAAASAAGGTTQAAADAFNSALGVSASSSTSASASPSAVATSTVVASSTAEATSSAVASATSVASSSASSAATTSSNVQTFTGDLGGLPPAVTETAGSDRPFSVDGDTFVNEAAALQRSCSVQNNACADAVNSGSLAGTTVADCNTQEDACNAAAAKK